MFTWSLWLVADFHQVEPTSHAPSSSHPQPVPPALRAACPGAQVKGKTHLTCPLASRYWPCAQVRPVLQLVHADHVPRSNLSFSYYMLTMCPGLTCPSAITCWPCSPVWPVLQLWHADHVSRSVDGTILFSEVHVAELVCFISRLWLSCCKSLSNSLFQISFTFVFPTMLVQPGCSLGIQVSLLCTPSCYNNITPLPIMPHLASSPKSPPQGPTTTRQSFPHLCLPRLLPPFWPSLLYWSRPQMWLKGYVMPRKEI